MLVCKCISLYLLYRVIKSYGVYLCVLVVLRLSSRMMRLRRENLEEDHEKLVHQRDNSPIWIGLRTSPSTHALARARILEDISIRYYLIILSFQIIRYFGFSRYIVFTIYLDNISTCIAKAMYLENSNRLIIC
jgi:hypothetical protein